MIHCVFIYRLLNIDYLWELSLSLTSDIQHNRNLDAWLRRIVGCNVQLIVVSISQLVSLQLNRHFNLFTWSHYIVLIRSKLNGIAVGDIHIGRSNTAGTGMIHDTTESEYTQLESIRIYIVLELEGTVLAENHLEVHTLHHRVAIVHIAYNDLVILSLVIYTIRRWSIHRVVTPEWADDVGIEGFCCWQTGWWLRELLVILYRCIERYETSIVDIHALVLLAIEWELEWKFHLLEVCLINIVCIRHVLSIVVGDVYPLVRYIEAIELRLEHIVYSRLSCSLLVGSSIP